MLRELSAENYPAIHHEEPIIYFRSGYVPIVGDYLKMHNIVVLVVEVYHTWNHGPRNWKCHVKGDHINELRQYLTYV